MTQDVQDFIADIFYDICIDAFAEKLQNEGLTNKKLHTVLVG